MLLCKFTRLCHNCCTGLLHLHSIHNNATMNWVVVLSILCAILAILAACVIIRLIANAIAYSFGQLVCLFFKTSLHR